MHIQKMMSEIHNKFSEKYNWYANWHNNHNYSLFHWTALLIISVFAGSIMSLVISSDSKQVLAIESNSTSGYDKKSISDTTTKVLRLSEQYNKSKNKSKLLPQLKEAVEERKQSILETAKSDPEEARSVLFDLTTKKDLPEEIRDSLEVDTSIEGNLIVAHADQKDLSSKFEYAIETSTGKIVKLYASENSGIQKLSDFKPKKVRVKGALVGDAIIAGNESVSQTEATVTTIDPDAIIKKVAIILFNWQNNTSQPISEDQARSVYFTSLDSAGAYTQENSFGKIVVQGKNRVDGDVLGYFTVPYNNDSCGDWTTIWSWGDAAISAAQVAGNDMSGYEIVTFVFPENYNCNWGGYAIVWTGHTAPNRNFVNGLSSFNTRVNAHELGHILGPH